jgi:hypothetical protein
MGESSVKQWASIAEIISAAAVVMSLIYVSMQIRHNTAAVQADTFKEVAAEWGGLQMAIIENSDFADILVKAEAGDSLTPSESYRLSTWVFYMFTNWEQAFLGHERGLLGEEEWLGWDRYYKWLVSQEHFSSAWQSNPVEGYAPSFIQYVNQHLDSIN